MNIVFTLVMWSIELLVSGDGEDGSTLVILREIGDVQCHHRCLSEIQLQYHV